MLRLKAVGVHAHIFRSVLMRVGVCCIWDISRIDAIIETITGSLMRKRARVCVFVVCVFVCVA